MRTGKALGRDLKEIAVHFRPVPHLPFGQEARVRPNGLSFGLEPENVALELTGTGQHPDTLAPLSSYEQVALTIGMLFPASAFFTARHLSLCTLPSGEYVCSGLSR
uniref:hypothetical protein n=1 Tax=Asanoa siamensis TaxID=926357 RepID=UPI001943E643